MYKVIKDLFGVFGRCVFGLFFLISSVSPSHAQEAVGGPFTRLLAGDLGLVDIAVVVLAAAAAATIASYEFAREKVSVFDVPTMPKYTVARMTYRYYNSMYIAIVFFLFVIVMENYEILRQMLISQDTIFDKLPNGDNIVTISVGSVALVVAVHYLRLPNTQIGPSWFLHRFRRVLHRRGRIPEEAQALAKQFLSDDNAVFVVPNDKISTVVNHADIQSVTEPDFHAAEVTIDYQWAIVSYLYMTGLDYETTPPYSSFVSNKASLWPEIKKAYDDLVPSIVQAKTGNGDASFEQQTQETLAKLRKNLSIFHACLHLFAVDNDPDRISKLNSLGLKQSAVFLSSIEPSLRRF